MSHQIGLNCICISISHFHGFLKATSLILLIFFLIAFTSTCLYLFFMFRIMAGGSRLSSLDKTFILKNIAYTIVLHFQNSSSSTCDSLSEWTEVIMLSLTLLVQNVA